jgi:cytochrome c heme-lyase
LRKHCRRPALNAAERRTRVEPSPCPAALNRKGKSDGIDGESSVSNIMEHVVHTHNSMNEATWDRVMRWEKLHPEAAGKVKLNRFIGRPDELSPLARLRTLLGMPKPFDRHDWYVLRNDEQEVRYVIDFYFDEAFAGQPEVRTCKPNLYCRCHHSLFDCTHSSTTRQHVAGFSLLNVQCCK